MRLAAGAVAGAVAVQQQQQPDFQGSLKVLQPKGQIQLRSGFSSRSTHGT